jgi:HSP20 family molecular chaperone IbpA
MKRSIPPRTMGDVSRKKGRRGPGSKAIRLFPKVGLAVNLGLGSPIRPMRTEPPDDSRFPTGLFTKPRNWRFQTKPLFKKIKGPLVDVFHEAEEVLIVIDLGGFRRGDIHLSMTPEEYSIVAKRGYHEFRETIPLPAEVATDRSHEHFRNGVLEIVLPRRKKAIHRDMSTASKRARREHDTQ